ncbi:MAG: hypothetical protein ACU837_06100 [Gammaproteobacteria bacterium]
MLAIEFETQTHDGMVEIPAQYLAWQNKKVKVILLDVENESVVASLQSELNLKAHESPTGIESDKQSVIEHRFDDEKKPFNPKQFFGVSCLQNIDRQLADMRNEWE